MDIGYSNHSVSAKYLKALRLFTTSIFKTRKCRLFRMRVHLLRQATPHLKQKRIDNLKFHARQAGCMTCLVKYLHYKRCIHGNGSGSIMCIERMFPKTAVRWTIVKMGEICLSYLVNANIPLLVLDECCRLHIETNWSHDNNNTNRL